LAFLAERQPAVVLLEACGSAHHWARQIEGLGHRPLLLPPHLVRPYVPRNKTDRTDTRGLLEAYRNRDIHPVPIKSLAHQALASLHRLRSAWMAAQTARLNTVRGLLREFGIAIPTGAHHVAPCVQAVALDPEAAIPASLRPFLEEVRAEVGELEERIHLVDRQLLVLGRGLPEVCLLRSIPGIGPLTATALVALVVDPHRFPTGRHFASYLGLTPRESSSGLRRRLGAISKRGDTYLRMLLTHGARAVLCGASRLERPDPLRSWALRVQARRGHNKATIALANKLARIAWAVWVHATPYEGVPSSPADGEAGAKEVK
jgi:transposase